MLDTRALEPHEAIHETLEFAAGHCDDLTDPVYQRFFRTHPEAAEMMKHVDLHVRGRMLNDVLSLLLSPAENTDRVLLEFEVASHRNYGVGEELYAPFLAAIRDTTRELAADIWDEHLEAGWNQRIEQLLTGIREMNARQARYALA
jgi:hemoglobin-like flavoprotein